MGERKEKSGVVLRLISMRKKGKNKKRKEKKKKMVVHESFFFFYMSTQEGEGKGENRFELVTFAS